MQRLSYTGDLTLATGRPATVVTTSWDTEYAAIRTDLDPAELHHCAEQMAQDFMPPGWQPVRSSPFARVASNAEKALFYKEFHARSPAERWKALVRGSRAERAWRNGDALRLAGIDTPVNVLRGRLPRGREYLFTTTVPGVRVDRLLREDLAAQDPASVRLRRQMLSELGVFIGRLHATGFIHGDLRPGNVLVERHHGHFHFGLVDNERVVRKRPPPGRMLLRNLMQLNMLPPAQLGTTDRLRFFAAWRRQMRDYSEIEAKVIGTEAFHWAMRRLYEKGRL